MVGTAASRDDAFGNNSKHSDLKFFTTHLPVWDTYSVHKEKKKDGRVPKCKKAIKILEGRKKKCITHSICTDKICPSLESS